MTTSQDVSYLCEVLRSWCQDGRRKEVTEEEMHSRTGNSMFEGRLFWGKGTVCGNGQSSEETQALENVERRGGGVYCEEMAELFHRRGAQVEQGELTQLRLDNSPTSTH